MNCLECGIETKNPKFCSRSCNAKSNNRNPSKKRMEKQGRCLTCQAQISSSLMYCKPCFAKYQIQPKVRKDGKLVNNFCSICGVEKTDKNKVKTKSGKPFSYCYQCHRIKIALKCRNFKAQCVEYKGGACEFCGYNKCQAALDFHHKDPSIKDGTIASVASRTFDDRTKSELDKCYILCANCHREEHFRLSNISLIGPLGHAPSTSD